tara:strand:+ start:67168 stop:67443 length:276 start_codon:yes stop_codon:yes gene_type:complete
MNPNIRIIRKRAPFDISDIITCWDEMLDRTITGYIINIVQANDGIYDLMIRWNDVFVAVEYCSVPEAKKRIRMKLWKYKPHLKYKKKTGQE